MKKQVLLASSIICAMSISAQMQSNKNSAKFGFTGKEALEDGSFKMSYTFNTNQGYNIKVSDSNGKGVSGMSITREGVNSNKATLISNDFKTENSGSSATAVHVKSIQALVDSLTFENEKPYSLTQNYWKYGNVLVDVAGDPADQAWTVYPGMAKRSMINFQIKTEDFNPTSDISFDLLTVDPGTSGNGTNVKLIVDASGKIGYFPSLSKTYTEIDNPDNDIQILDTLTAANVHLFNEKYGTKLMVAENIYETVTDGSLNKKTIRLGEVLQVDKSIFAGTKVNVFLYMPSNGKAVQPGSFDALVGLDNISVTYGVASWSEPVVDESKTATITGTAAQGVETGIKFRMKGTNRVADLVLKSDGDHKTSTKFYFKPEGCVMAKNKETGAYDIPVDYTYTMTDGMSTQSILKIAKEVGKAFDDDLEFTIYTTLSSSKSFYRLEASNGSSVYLNFKVESATGLDATGADQLKVTTAKNGIRIQHATQPIVVSTLSGKLVANVAESSEDLFINLTPGVYIVASGNESVKVIVP
ncbi:MAG: DUF6383 domain-containing protein [Bacteroidales bacterium]